MGLRGLTCDLALNDLLASICNILLPLKQNANWVETESTSKICWTRQGKRGWVGWRRWVYCVVLFRAVTPDPHRRPSIKQMEEPICYILRRRQIQYRPEKYLVTPWSIHTRCSCFWNYFCCFYHLPFMSDGFASDCLKYRLFRWVMHRLCQCTGLHRIAECWNEFPKKPEDEDLRSHKISDIMWYLYGSPWLVRVW